MDDLAVYFGFLFSVAVEEIGGGGKCSLLCLLTLAWKGMAGTGAEGLLIM